MIIFPSVPQILVFDKLSKKYFRPVFGSKTYDKPLLFFEQLDSMIVLKLKLNTEANETNQANLDLNLFFIETQVTLNYSKLLALDRLFYSLSFYEHNYVCYTYSYTRTREKK